jgi:multiple sugar transport system permease protein
MSLKAKSERFLLYLFLTVGAVVVGFPFFWMVISSLKPLEDVVKFPPTIIPTRWMFSNYIEAWKSAPFARYFVNTLLVVSLVTIGVLLTSSLAAYAFALMEFKGKSFIFSLFLATMMVPYEVTLIPNFVLIRKLGWYNTYAALIIPWSCNAFSVFLLRQFFMNIPKDLFDAARIDGCGELGMLWRVAIPLSTPAILTVSLFSFLGSWNALLWPLVVTSSEDMRVLQVGLAVFLREEGTQYHLLMAAASFTIAPIVVLYFIFQRRFIEGIVLSGLKG